MSEGMKAMATIAIIMMLNGLVIVEKSGMINSDNGHKIERALREFARTRNASGRT